MNSREDNRFKSLLVFVVCFFLGVLGANALVKKLDVSIHSDRVFFNHEIQQALTPNTEKNSAIQQAIYSQRISYLKSETEELALKKKAVEDYIKPLEDQIIDYRFAFSEKTKQSFDERLELYIDLVHKHSSYDTAKQSADYVPLEVSDSLLTFPSIHNDLISQLGGDLARAHNEFINEPRDASIAAHYEPALKQFFSQQEIESFILECHAQICAIHLTNRWQDPYYDGLTALKDLLKQQPWFTLEEYQSVNEYRGNGRHIGAWYFKVGS